MKLEAWEPDLQSLYARYVDGSLDLQPAFQRGLVWSREKKARLVDTILRGWRIPPVHLIVQSDERLSVLDGQQRLQSLFDFIDGGFAVQEFPPFDEAVSTYAGHRFKSLPVSVQRRVLSSRVSSYRLFDYAADEPYELFFRLNLPTGLTQAEKRNALAGRAREQVRDLVASAERAGWGKDLLGFSDGRLAYDDVIARLCAYLERQSIAIPLTVRDMEDFYREPAGFSVRTEELARIALETFTYAARSADNRIRLNKATLLTWLIVAARAKLSDVQGRVKLTGAMEELELARLSYGRSSQHRAVRQVTDPAYFAPIAALYLDRSSLRVADVLSVQARDAVAWLAVAYFNADQSLPPIVRELRQNVAALPFQGSESFEDGLLSLVSAWPQWSDLR
ncbi:DUF262 domain-containing protein [Agromyces sp. H3Y2-19a]|uniref:DUF262 domain-containing protein n=1 Tax=Agromyces chromiiresistens TaxID=3030835 RepID=UPI0023B9B1C5|nr:DUF262 domain-containing protein [Agromyces chromiiresistens]MDF0514294.1 DUF262 domain-containing protein [Agromyces chromiiresistens]